MNAQEELKVLAALREIRTIALGHPSCNREEFERRDIHRLLQLNSDEFAWTVVAVRADDALRKLEW